jgi:hypothetical protein
VVRDCHASDLQCAAALGVPFGDLVRTVGLLRQPVCSGGWLVIDDGFLAHSSTTERPGYAYDRSHEATLRALTARGDDLAQEVIVPREELEA